AGDGAEGGSLPHLLHQCGRGTPGKSGAAGGANPPAACGRGGLRTGGAARFTARGGAIRRLHPLAGRPADSRPARLPDGPPISRLLAAVLCCLTLAAARTAVCAEPSATSTQLVVAGEVQRELRLSPDDVREIAKRRGIAEQNGYRAVRLADLLAEAGMKDDAKLALRRTYVVAIAADDYPAVFSWGGRLNTAVGRAVLVAVDRDGVPLREGEGRFALVSLADERPGPRHVKWLTRIDVRRVPEGAPRQR